MILMIDNYDSFVYNLYQLIGSINQNIQVVRNDHITISDIEQMQPTHIIISPGPGRPCDAGIIEKVIQVFSGRIPILGVCLGHQAIIEAFGGHVIYAKKVMHGKSSAIEIDQSDPIFKGVDQKTTVARYHSLAGDTNTIPDCLKIIAKSDDGEIMAVKHKDYQVYGLQFHPESILTKQGHVILQNFLEVENND